MPDELEARHSVEALPNRFDPTSHSERSPIAQRGMHHHCEPTAQSYAGFLSAVALRNLYGPRLNGYVPLPLRIELAAAKSHLRAVLSRSLAILPVRPSSPD